MMRGLGD